MKIGIITYCKVANFGANLQALSTYYYLLNHKHQPVIIDWFPPDLEKRVTRENKTIQSEEHLNFVKKQMLFTKRCKTSEDVANIIEEDDIDAIIIGSDAVLQHTPFLRRLRPSRKTLLTFLKIDSTRKFPNVFWGDFLRFVDVPAAIMSASNQGSNYFNYPSWTKRNMNTYLHRFGYISVRDTWTQSMVLNVTNGIINPSLTPDPVFEFQNNCAQILPSVSEVKNKYGIRGNYVLVSFRLISLVKELGKEWFSTLQNFFRKEGKECYILPMPNGVPYKYADMPEIVSPLDPVDWYLLIKYASAYVGQNMHPVVVALSNRVPLFCFDDYVSNRKKSTSKIKHILNTFSLGDFCTDVYRHNNHLPSAEFVYDKVNGFDKKFNWQKLDIFHADYNKMMKNILESFSMIHT